MKNRFVIVAISALTALAAGGITAYWFLNQRSFGGRNLPVGITAVPQDVLMTISLSTDQNQWERLQRLGTDESQARLNSLLNEWRDRLLTANNLNYTDDIQPWIGDEITIALMGPTSLNIPSTEPSENGNSDDASSDVDQNSDTEQERSDAEGLDADASESDSTEAPLDLDPDLIDPAQEQAAVIFLPIADPLEAQSILTSAMESGPSPTERDHRGITIQTFQQDDMETYEVAVFDRKLLVIATQAMVLDSVIDTYKGQPSVVDTPGYENAVRAVSTAQPIAQVYVNAHVARTITAANSTEIARSRNLAPLQNTQGFTATATINPNGVRLRGISWLLPDSDPFPMENQGRNQLAAQLPDSTLIVLSGSNLKTLWDGYSQRTDDEAEGPFAPKNLRSASQTVLGLDLETDVIAWMSGDFALALASTANASSDLRSAGLVFMIEASDRELAKRTLTQLDETVESRYRFRVTDAQLGGTDVINWQSPFAAITITRGWLDDEVAFLGFNNVTKNMVPEPSNSLENLDVFRQATASQPNANTGYFFINLEEFVQARDQLPVPTFPEEQAAFVDAIRAIGVTTSVEGDRQLRYDISVVTHSNNSAE